MFLYAYVCLSVIKWQVWTWLGFFAVLAVTFAAGVEKEGDDPLDWLRNSIPGEPGVDYPIFSAVEQTQFECGDDKVFGGKSFS